MTSRTYSRLVWLFMPWVEQQLISDFKATAFVLSQREQFNGQATAIIYIRWWLKVRIELSLIMGPVRK